MRTLDNKEPRWLGAGGGCTWLVARLGVRTAAPLLAPAPGCGVGCVTGHAVTRRHDPRTKVAATKTNTPTLRHSPLQ